MELGDGVAEEASSTDTPGSELLLNAIALSVARSSIRRGALSAAAADAADAATSAADAALGVEEKEEDHHGDGDEGEESIAAFLPVELLLQIFQHMSAVTLLSTLGSVCQHWRDVAELAIGAQLDLSGYEASRIVNDRTL